MGGKEGDEPRGATLYWSSVNPVKKKKFKNPALAGSFAGGHAVVCDFLMKAKTQPSAQLAWKTDGVTRLSRYSGAAVATVTVQPEGLLPHPHRPFESLSITWLTHYCSIHYSWCRHKLSVLTQRSFLCNYLSGMACGLIVDFSGANQSSKQTEWMCFRGAFIGEMGETSALDWGFSETP